MAQPSKGSKQAKRDAATGQFLPGNKSGGRKRLPEDLKAAFRAACPAALETLKEIMLNSNARDSDRVRAAEIILDRGYGKPTQAVEVDAVHDGVGGVIIIPAVSHTEKET